MKCTACGLAQKREGIRGEKRKGKVEGAFPFFLSQISSSFPLFPPLWTPATQANFAGLQKVKYMTREREPSMQSLHVNDLR